MKVGHFYHLFAGSGLWRDAVHEHFRTLDAALFDGPFGLGIVGSAEQREEALVCVQSYRSPDLIVHADSGWEQVTLNALRLYVHNQHRQRTEDKVDAVMYAHTKGAHDPSQINIAWRESMTWHLVRRWKDAAQALHQLDVDAVGCHWLTTEEFGAVPGTPLPCFGGNYWLASCDYLRQLPACASTCRHDAEGWIGQGNPRVLDLHPGWPGKFSRHQVALGFEVER